MTTTAAIEVIGVSKVFPGVRALHDVNFSVRPGEVHVLLGENGAGKSTLVKVMSGAVQPDGGTIMIEGKPRTLNSPHVSQAAGISTVHQELSLIPDLTVAQNIFLGREKRRSPLRILDRAGMLREARDMLASLGSDIDPALPVRELSIALRQVVEIVSALARSTRVLILDEPTSSLSNREAEELFRRIEYIKADGVGICYITHRLDEIERLADRITVMRDGEVVAQDLTPDVPREQLVRHMVGREIEQEFPSRNVAIGRPLLEVEDVTLSGRVERVNFSVSAGEVIGIFGLIGAGRTELVRSLFGLERDAVATVRIAGSPVSIRNPRDALVQGLALVPEERHAQGLVLSMSVEENICLSSLKQCSQFGALSRASMARIADAGITRLRIKALNRDVLVNKLSGGNQQKVVIARTLAAGSTILLLDEPTRGVDVGARVEIYQLINQLASEGKAIVVVSSELPEILGLSDRILVMRNGELTAIMDRADATQETLLQAALPQSRRVA